MTAAAGRGDRGRVNGPDRAARCARERYDSVDGTFLAFGPDTNLPRLARMLRRAHEPTLPMEAAP